MLQEKIKKDLDGALKSGDKEKVSVLRMLWASLQDKEKKKKYELSLNNEEVFLSEEEVIDIITSEAKKRRESIKEFRAGQREDLVVKEEAELKILADYLPEPVSEDDLIDIIKEVIKEMGVKDQKELGKVMSVVMSKVKGRADGGDVIRIAKGLLS